MARRRDEDLAEPLRAADFPRLALRRVLFLAERLAVFLAEDLRADFLAPFRADFFADFLADFLADRLAPPFLAAFLRGRAGRVRAGVSV